MNEIEIGGVIKLIGALAASGAVLRIGWAGASFLISLRKDLTAVTTQFTALVAEMREDRRLTSEHREDVIERLSAIEQHKEILDDQVREIFRQLRERR